MGAHSRTSSMVMMPRDVSMSAVTVAGARTDQNADVGSSNAARRWAADGVASAGFGLRGDDWAMLVWSAPSANAAATTMESECVFMSRSMRQGDAAGNGCDTIDSRV